MIKILFATSSAFTLPILKSIVTTSIRDSIADLHATQCSVFGVEPIQDTDFNSIEVEVLTYPQRALRGKLLPHPIIEFCTLHQIPYHTHDDLNEAVTDIGSIDIGIVASFGKLLKQPVLEWPTYGWINWHPSKLPEYRGASPMQATLEHGDRSSALSWIQMGPGMDDGDLWLQIPVEIPADQDFSTLSMQMGQLGADSWTIPAVKQALSTKSVDMSPTPQQGEPSYVYKISKEHKNVDYTQKSAREIINHWRAYRSFPGTVVTLEYWGSVKLLSIKESNDDPIGEELFDSKELMQIKVNSQSKILLKCAKGTFLELQQISFDSGKKLDLKGYILK